MPTYSLDAGPVGDSRVEGRSSTGTYQLLDPLRLPLLAGPYATTGTDLDAYHPSGFGAAAYYAVDYSLRTGTFQRLWHYRVALASLYSARVSAGRDEARIFLVLERYPFVAGTNYINDLPEIGVFLVQVDGTLLTTLRPFQAGLRSSGIRLISANGHRALWTLGVGPLTAVTQYIHSNLDTGAETILSTAQLTALLQGTPRLYTPDFVWDHTDPQTFFAVAGLPTLTEDDVLAPYGALLDVGGNPTGSVRIVNDADVLDPLDRYQVT